MYRRELLDDERRLFTFQRIGFALDDVRRYDDALSAFRFLEEKAAIRNELDWLSFSFIWQGHMLDLLGRRDEAMERYRRVRALGHDDGWQHDQYGLQYRYLAHAAARLAAPFQRSENRKP